MKPNKENINEKKIIDFSENFPNISSEEIKIIENFAIEMLWLKDAVMREFDNSQSKVDIPCRQFAFDIQFNTDSADLLRELIMTDKRIREVCVDYDMEKIILYPSRPDYEYGNIRIIDKKYECEAAMNQYYDNLDDAVEFYDFEYDRKANVIIEKIIELNEKDFKFFGDNIQQETRFLDENSNSQYIDSQRRPHCLFIRQEGNDYGILIYRDTAHDDFYSGYIPSLDEFQEISMEEDNDMKEQSGPEMF